MPDYAAQRANEQLLSLKKQQIGAQIAKDQEERQQRQKFDEDLTQVLLNPSAGNISGLILKHPEFAKEVKSAWDVKDKAARDADLTQSAEVFSAASAGKYDLAAKLLRNRIEADKAAGHEDPSDQAILDALESGDPVQQKAAVGMIGVHLAGATGAEHFGTVYASLGGKPDIRSVEMGGSLVKVDPATGESQAIYESPYVKGPDGEILIREGAESPAATAAPPPANLPAPAAAVASTLSSVGMPSHVVAGFLGNFHAEGGYGRAKGDGGTASGIGQWRGDRAANFQRVIGKPVSEASPEEQARFVAWEMQNPEQAGMTTAQRDAILNAKSAPQAAALIDQYYERSDGSARPKRMAAAAAIAGGSAPPGFRVLVPGKAKDAPSGYRYSADGTTLEAIPGGPADVNDALDPATVSFYAQQILAGGQMPTLGMGKSAAAARQAIMREVARTARSLGISGRDLATQQAHFANAKKALGVLETQAATVEANEQTALANGQQFLDRSKELSGKTRFPIVNAATMAYLRHTGDPTVIAMDNAYNTFITEYAKVVAGSPSGAGVLSDSARHEAMSTLKGNYAYAQKEAAFKQMQKDMANRMAAIHAGIAHGYNNMTHIPGSTRELSVSAGLPKGTKVIGTYQGKRVIEVNGKRMVEQ